MAQHEVSDLNDAVAEGVLFGQFVPSTVEKWAALTDEDAALARGALRRAQEIRTSLGEIPARTYLEAIGDSAMYRQRLREAQEFHRELSRTDTPDLPNDLAGSM